MYEKGPEAASQEWEVEVIYFGLHDGQTYRRQGERVQAKIERDIPLNPDKDDGASDQYLGSPEGISEFLSEHDDCALRVADSYDLVAGGTEPPRLWVEGWKDIPEDFREEYERQRAWAIEHGQISG